LSNRIDILIQVAFGLQSLHSVGVAHVDLKMENIMKFGNEFKLIDIESSIDFSQPISEDVVIKSSLSTMPPELYEFNVNKLTLSIDIWSYGMIY